MYLNNFSLTIHPGKEQPGGYVELEHNTKYIINLRNSNRLRCDAKVEIDGKDIGTFRLNGGRTFRLERPSNDKGCFTFYRLGSEESFKAGLRFADHEKAGLISVIFTPEREPEPSQLYPKESVYRDASTTPTAGAAAGMDVNYTVNYSPGGTGLSGHSNQEFVNVAELDYDYARRTVINIRLVLKNGDEPRPLAQLSTPVPPPAK